MADESATGEKTTGRTGHTPPAGAQMTAKWTAGGVSVDYTASAQWLVLRKKDKPAAEIFSVSTSPMRTGTGSAR